MLPSLTSTMEAACFTFPSHLFLVSPQEEAAPAARFLTHLLSSATAVH